VPHADLDHEGAVHGLFRTTVADRPESVSERTELIAAKRLYGLPLRCKGVFALRIQDRTADDISGL
jgi:hypothetical protein